MSSPDKSRHVEVKEGGQTVAAAEVTTSDGPEGTDAVMDLPEVQASSRLEATVPLGDADSLQRLRERTQDPVTRPAGSTALVDADIPPAGQTPAS